MEVQYLAIHPLFFLWASHTVPSLWAEWAVGFIYIWIYIYDVWQIVLSRATENTCQGLILQQYSVSEQVNTNIWH